MRKDVLCYKRCLITAVVFHLLIFGLLLFHLPGKAPAPIVHKSTRIVHAVTVDQKAVDKEVARIKQQVLDKQAHEKAEMAKLKAAEKKLADLKRKQVAAKKQIEADKKAHALALKKLEAKKAATKKDLAALAKRKALEKAQAKTRADEAAAKKLQQKANQLQRKLAAEKEQAARSQAIEGEVNKYKGLIVEAIAQRWLVPQGTDRAVSCKLNIHLAPGGTVVNVTVVKSSGNLLLDRSAVAAVYKASPLPVPQKSSAFDEFRQFQLTVKPEGYIDGA
jgi:colicin import membrane protein